MTSFFTLARCAICAALIAGSAREAHAQSPTDSLFRRAKRLVAEGNGAAGRALVDSVLRGATEGSAPYGDALYWRGALAETAADAERDYRRVIVEYPLSPYVDQALLAMADLETARGDRAGALQHLQQFVKEHPANTPARGAAALSAARLAFEQRDTRVGCAMVSAARASTPATNVEQRNQIDYLGGRCAGTDVATAGVTMPATSNVGSALSTAAVTSTPATSAPTPRDTASRSVPKVLPALKDTTSRAQSKVASPPPQPTTTAVAKSAPPPPTTPTVKKGTYTIQLAAYNTRPEAERLVAKLKAKGVDARVSGNAKPFRVRLDFYPTRQAAQDEVNSLKGRGIIGFVTTETPPPSSTP